MQPTNDLKTENDVGLSFRLFKNRFTEHKQHLWKKFKG